MSLLLVSNPASGSADGEVLEAVEVALQRSSTVTPFRASSAEAFAEELRVAAAQFELIVVAGGDGTLSHAVNALADRLDRVTFALIPLGTGNDLARTLGLSRDPTSVANGFETGEVATLDLGRVSARDLDRLFVNACVGGFSAEVNEAIDEDEKRRLGPVAFWVGGARAARGITRYRVQLAGEVLDDAVVVGIGNGRSAGGGFELWRDARPDDGVLNACAISAPNLITGLRAAAKVKRGRHHEESSVTTLNAPQIDLRAEPEMELNIDGELMGLRTPASFRIDGKFRMLLPARPVPDA